MLKSSFPVNRFTMVMVLRLVLVIIMLAFGIAGADDSHMVTKEQLRSMLAKPDVIIIDVRSSHDWNKSKVKIPGAVREEGMKFGSWMGKYPKDKTIVLYCA
jgi:hypothetical protein